MNSGRLPQEQMYIGYFNRGTANRHSGQYEKAIADFTQTLALNPKFARAYQLRGMVQDDLGERDKAIADIDKAIAMDPKDWSSFYGRAVVLRAGGDVDAAQRDLQTAAELKPKAGHVPLMRALILADKGSYDAARAEINKVVATGKDDAAAAYARAFVAFDEQRYDAAEPDLNRALKLRGDFAAAHMLMGRILEARGDKPGATARYDKALASPADFFDSRMARRVARERLAMVADPTRRPADKPAVADAGQKAAEPETLSKSSAIESDAVIATKATADASRVERPIDCRVFLPASGVTVASKCSE